MTLHPEIEIVTERIVERSRATRVAYLDLIARERELRRRSPDAFLRKSCTRLCSRRRG